MTGTMLRRLSLAAALAVVTWVGVGCESGDSGHGSDSSFVGTWTIYDQTAGPGAGPWYVHFQSDGTFFFSTGEDGSGAGATGNYTVSGGQLDGDIENPGVGQAHVTATLDGDTINLSFIEHWHTPFKVVPYTGTKG